MTRRLLCTICSQVVDNSEEGRGCERAKINNVLCVEQRRKRGSVVAADRS